MSQGRGKGLSRAGKEKVLLAGGKKLSRKSRQQTEEGGLSLFWRERADAPLAEMCWGGKIEAILRTARGGEPEENSRLSFTPRPMRQRGSRGMRKNSYLEGNASRSKPKWKSVMWRRGGRGEGVPFAGDAVRSEKKTSARTPLQDA